MVIVVTSFPSTSVVKPEFIVWLCPLRSRYDVDGVKTRVPIPLGVWVDVLQLKIRQVAHDAQSEEQGEGRNGVGPTKEGQKLR
jgi:hypothetical protein